jgi:hypothetical protein
MLLARQRSCGERIMARDVALIYVIASVLFCVGATMILSTVP